MKTQRQVKKIGQNSSHMELNVYTLYKQGGHTKVCCGATVVDTSLLVLLESTQTSLVIVCVCFVLKHETTDEKELVHARWWNSISACRSGVAVHKKEDCKQPAAVCAPLSGTLPLFSMTPSLLRKLAFILGFLTPILCFKSSPRLPVARPRKFNHENISPVMAAAGSRAAYVRSCAAAIIVVATAQTPISSSATTPTTVVSALLASACCWVWLIRSPFSQRPSDVITSIARISCSPVVRWCCSVSAHKTTFYYCGINAEQRYPPVKDPLQQECDTVLLYTAAQRR